MIAKRWEERPKTTALSNSDGSLERMYTVNNPSSPAMKAQNEKARSVIGLDFKMLGSRIDTIEKDD